MAELETENAPTTSGNMGMVKGVPGRNVENIGMLDLRGVTLEEMKGVESLKNIGAVLIDPPLRSVLSTIHTENLGSVIEVPEDCQVMVEPWQEFTRETVEAMTAGLKLCLVGMVLFRPDVPPALISEKFHTLHVVGILMATAGVQGALLGKLHITGVPVTLPSDREQPILHNIGQNKVSKGYLKYVADSALYINLGQTIIENDVPEELVAAKFASYINVGQTVATADITDLLKARCVANLGNFAIADDQSAG